MAADRPLFDPIMELSRTSAMLKGRMNPVLELDDLSKTFSGKKGRVEALCDVNLAISPHQVFGFLGPNGAGKSTTIRLMLDLIRPTSGRVLMHGVDVRSSREAVQSIGALVEDAAFYRFLTAHDNLSLLARTAGHDVNQVPGLLSQVGLGGNEHRAVKEFSTGMKQRLGMAAALLGDPEVLILDEPTNGLDPAGMHEMRQFLRMLVDERGKTVILSSHILSEVELICDRVAIIHMGRIVRETSVDELRRGRAHLRVEVEPVHTAASVLQPHWVVEVEAVKESLGWLRISTDEGQAPFILRELLEHDIDVYQMHAQHQSLEEYFLEATTAEKLDD